MCKVFVSNVSKKLFFRFSKLLLFILSEGTRSEQWLLLVNSTFNILRENCSLFKFLYLIYILWW